MANNEIINVDAFAANYLGRVARAPTRGIFVEGMITQTAEHLRYSLNLSYDTPVTGKTKIDMESLIHQGMIPVTHKSYSLMSQGQFVLESPAPNMVGIIDRSNWLYASSTVDEENNHNMDDFVAGDMMEEDATCQQQFVPPIQEPTQQGPASFSMNQDQWMWMQVELGDLRVEQTRQGVEQIRQWAMLEEMQSLMQQLMLHFPPPPQWG